MEHGKHEFVYYTIFQPQKYHQMSLEEYLFVDNPVPSYALTHDKTSTRVYKLKSDSKVIERLGFNIPLLIKRLEDFNKDSQWVREVENRHELYETFKIPKRNGHGLRTINAPLERLKSTLGYLKAVLEQDFSSKYHTSAYAYIKGRCTIDAVKKHQKNESRWFAKFDLHDFFGSTSLDWLMYMLSYIYPFSEVMMDANGEKQLRDALELAFLDGGLPQGTPVSPTITNLMMIPIDYRIANDLRDFNHNNFIYTRYADDYIISCKYTFNCKQVENRIVSELRAWNAPFCLNQEKTKYVSRSGHLYLLGVCLNQDNNITIGYKNKRRFKAMISNYAQDRKHGIRWETGDVMYMQGLISYYKMVEPECITEIINKYSQKYSINIPEAIRSDLG